MVTTLQFRIQRDEEDLLPSTNARGSCGGKADLLAKAGISTKGAQRYEELAFGRGSTRAYNLAIERDEMIMEAWDFSMNTTESSNKALAHSLARLGLGVDIALHGFVRLPDLSGFAAGMQKQFAETFLPGSLVYATGYCIAIGETIIGTLLALGLWVRPALTSGSLLMILLLAGISLLQNWSVAALQFAYRAFYAAVLATATCDRFSVDGVLGSRAG
jgi:thiosulfate dehydrogenase (quinone) large subunit